MGIDPVDAGVIGLILVSGLFAFFRGFIREVLAIAGWVGAALVTLWTFPVASPLARGWISHPLVADGAAILVVFVAVLIVVTFISHALATRVHASSLGALDRSLGFLFGLARGGVIVCVAYLLLTMMGSQDEDPAWLKGARTLPLVRGGAEVLYALVPPSLRDQGTATAQEIGAKGAAAVEGAQTLQRLDDVLAAPPPPAPGAPQNPGGGYTDSERQPMEQLFKNLQGQ